MNTLAVNYLFGARDEDVGIDLDCFIRLAYAESTAQSMIGDMCAKFILGEFDASAIAKQAYDWFVGQHNVVIDQNRIEAFLTVIQDNTSTPFVAVMFVIAPKPEVSND